METYKEQIKKKIELKFPKKKTKLVSALNKLKNKKDITLWMVRNNLKLNQQQTTQQKKPVTQQKKPVTQQKKPVTQPKKQTTQPKNTITQPKKQTTPTTQQKIKTPTTQQTTPPKKQTTPPKKQTTPPKKQTTPPKKQTTPPKKQTTPTTQQKIKTPTKQTRQQKKQITQSKKSMIQQKKQTIPTRQQKKQTTQQKIKTQQKKKTPTIQTRQEKKQTTQSKKSMIQQKRKTPTTQQKIQRMKNLSQQQYLQYLEEEYKNVGLQKKNFNYFHVPMDNLCGFHSITLYYHLHNKQVSNDHTLNLLELRNRLIMEYENELKIDSPIDKNDIHRRIDGLSNIKEWLSDEDFAILSKIYNVCFYVYREDQKLWQIYSYEIPMMNTFDESNRECEKLINQNTSNPIQRTKIYLRATGVHYDLLLDKNININNINFSDSSTLTKINNKNTEWRNEYEFNTKVNLPGFYDNDFDDESSTYSDFFNSFSQLGSEVISQNKLQKKSQKKNQKKNQKKTQKKQLDDSISSSLTSYNYSDIDDDIFDSEDEDYKKIINKFNSNVIRQIPEQNKKIPVKTDQQLRKIVQKCFSQK